jgi:hypothetical protein
MKLTSCVVTEEILTCRESTLTCEGEVGSGRFIIYNLSTSFLASVTVGLNVAFDRLCL